GRARAGSTRRPRPQRSRYPASGEVKLVVVVDLLRKPHPGMLPRLPDRHPRRREAGIRERPDGHGDEIRLRRKRVEDRRAALGAEVEAARFPFVRDSNVLAVAALGSHPGGLEPRLEAEWASRPPLATQPGARGA